MDVTIEVQTQSFLDAMKKAADGFRLFGARLGGYPVRESVNVKPGEVFVSRDPREIIIYKPTEIERIVRLGVREAHPWFRDPLDPMKMVR